MTSSILEGETIEKIRRHAEELKKVVASGIHVAEVAALLNNLFALLADRDTIIAECEHLQAIFRDFLLDSEVARLAHEIGRNEGILEERLRLTGARAKTALLSADAMASGNIIEMEAQTVPINVGDRLGIDSLTGLLTSNVPQEETLCVAMTVPNDQGRLQVRVD